MQFSMLYGPLVASRSLLKTRCCINTADCYPQTPQTVTHFYIFLTSSCYDFVPHCPGLAADE